jgi:hypothetical protein
MKSEKEVFVLLFDFIREFTKKDEAVCKIINTGGFDIDSIY